MMTDEAPRRLTDADVAAFYGLPFDQLTITQQALSDEYWARRAATGQAGCRGSSCSCRPVAVVSPTYVCAPCAKASAGQGGWHCGRCSCCPK